MNKYLLALFLFFLLVPVLVLGQAPKNRMTLLAVQDINGTLSGSQADLFMEIKEGESRVFLETFPLTKMDTQISTRFAKDIACSYFNLNCQKYDFIYTIQAKSNIIGGPSAGAAIAALTAITLLDLDYRTDVTITGTINSGGVIGPVGGIKEKLDAAAANNIKTVLIAQGTAIEKEEEEKIDLIAYGKTIGLEVIEVADLNQVVEHLTGQELKPENGPVPLNPEYQRIMEDLKGVLCNRTAELQQKVNAFPLVEEEQQDIRTKINQSTAAEEEQNYYAAASFCFGTNVFLKGLWYKKDELLAEEVDTKITTVRENIPVVEERLAQEQITTIADLQTALMVKERLADVKNQLDKFNTTSEDRYQALAYTEERLFSALSWMTFFAMPGKEFVMDARALQESCQEKIAESEERHQYLSIILGSAFQRPDIEEKIDQAQQAQENEEYDLCLVQASEAKADANLILSGVAIPEDNLDVFVGIKIKAAERLIAENSAEGVFPLIGYSYFQYAQALRESEPFSALLFTEYALEFSDMQMYFAEENVAEALPQQNRPFQRPSSFAQGLVVGAALMFVILVTVWSTSGKARRRRK